MSITTIVIIITFLAALSEKFSSKPTSERKGILKKLKLENITILLLGVILLFQLFDNVNKEKEDKIEKNKSADNYERIYSTEEKVNEANKLIDSILISLKKEVELTREEFDMIQVLNEDMKNVRQSIKINLTEYRQLNEKYSEQLALEKQKIKNSKPDVRVVFPKSTYDSISINFQFQLINYGQRIADSIHFEAVMVLVDTNRIFSTVSEIKTNKKSHNVLNLPPEQGRGYIANGIMIPMEDTSKYSHGYLLAKYSYYDRMTDKKIENSTEIFRCSSIDRNNGQYAINTEISQANNIKKYLKRTNKETYQTFF